MTRVIVNTDEAPKHLAGYSQAVKSGGFVFVSGQGPFDARTGEGTGTSTIRKKQAGIANLLSALKLNAMLTSLYAYHAI